MELNALNMPYLSMGKRGAIKFEHQTLKQKKLLGESVITDSWYSILQHVAETYVEVFFFKKNNMMFEHHTITILS